jgi:hypothetical protein
MRWLEPHHEAIKVPQLHVVAINQLLGSRDGIVVVLAGETVWRPINVAGPIQVI